MSNYIIDGAVNPLSPVGAKLLAADASGNVGWVGIPPAKIKNVAILGDSLVEMNGYGQNASALTQTGGVASATIAAHGIPVGERVYVKGAGQADYNGWHVVTATPDANTLQYAVPVGTVSPATHAAGESAIQIRTDARMPGSAWFQWLNGRLGGTLNLVLNAGHGGASVELATSRVAEVVASGADTVILLVGHADLFWSTETAADVFADWKALADALISYGLTVVAVTLEADSDTGIGTTRKKVVQDFNYMLMEYASETRGVIAADIYSALVNPTSATGIAKSNVHQPDKIHLANLGADLVGEAIKTAISDHVHRVNYLPSSIIQTANKQIFANPLMQGAAGGVLNVSGTAADSMIAMKFGTGTWTGSSADRTAVADGDVIGKNAILSTANAVSGDTVFLGTGDLVASLGSNTQLWAIAHVQITGAARLAALKVGLLAKVGSDEQWCTALEWWSGMQTGMQDINLVMRTPVMITPSGMTELMFYLQCVAGTTGAISMKIGRLGIYAE